MNRFKDVVGDWTKGKDLSRIICSLLQINIVKVRIFGKLPKGILGLRDFHIRSELFSGEVRVENGTSV